MKSMDMRDRARSDLYLAQLRSQSAPNTPGFGPKSPSYSMYGAKSPAFSQYALSPRFPPSSYKSLGDINEAPAFTPGRQMAEPKSAFAAAAAVLHSEPAPGSRPFHLQAPPKKAPSATPKLGSETFKTPDTPTAPVPDFTVQEHGPTAPGEQQYDAVPIPGAYADAAVRSPPAGQTSFNFGR
jgi:hypothetical protein